jgi:hypothetical protein
VKDRPRGENDRHRKDAICDAKTMMVELDAGITMKTKSKLFMREQTKALDQHDYNS